MQTLNLPGFKPKVTEKDKRYLIFDPLRKKYVALTPEEWVRQHFVNYLTTEKGYPQELAGNEIRIQLNGTVKRCDTIIYDRYLSPVMVIEYKAPSIPITQSVVDQVVRYNMTLRVPYIIISNGMNHYCCKINYEEQSYAFLEGIPAYEAL